MTEAVVDISQEYEALVQFLYNAPVGLVQTSHDGEILMINPVSAQLLMPLSRDGGFSNLFDALESVVPDLRVQAQQFRGRHGMVCEGLRLPVSAGARGRFDAQILSLTLLKLDEQRLMAVISDISQQVRRERLLQHSEVWLNAILTGISDYAIVGLNAQGELVGWNAGIERLTGYGEQAVHGRSLRLFQPVDASSDDRVRDQLQEADANGWSLDEGWRVKADGKRFWGSALIAPLHRWRDGPGGEAGPEESPAVGPRDFPAEAAYCLVLRDISDKREASEQQRQASECDHLTGIANRRAFFRAAELEIERWHRTPRPLSMIIVDADHFKQVNDRHGHAAGDAVLRHLALTLSSLTREIDVAARVGGEEFAVLLPSTDEAGGRQIAERIRASIEAALVSVEPAQVRYTISAGVASMSEDLGGLDELMKKADRALYAAKAAGRNRVMTASPAP